MKTSIFFLAIFTAGILTDMPVEWESFLWGTAFGVSIVRLALPLLKE